VGVRPPREVSCRPVRISSSLKLERALPNKPLKLTAERVGAMVRGGDQGSPGRFAHGKLHAGRSLAAIR
jgi:hypothetical protein